MLEEKEKKEIDSLFEEKDKITKRLDEINERLEEIRLKEIADIMQMKIGAFYLFRYYRSSGVVSVYFQWTDKCKLNYDTKRNYFEMDLSYVYLENLSEGELSIMPYTIGISPDDVKKQLHTITEFDFKKRIEEFKVFITNKFQLK